MDALVVWTDKTENIVKISDLKCVHGGKTFKEGQKVKMLWKGKYYYGIIKDIGTASDSDSDDDEPLSSLANQIKHKRKSQVKGDDQNSSCDEEVSTRDTKKQNIENTDLDELPSECESNASSEMVESPVYDSDKDPPYVPDSHVKQCEVSDCQVEVFSACHICSKFLCFEHFENMGPCRNDHKVYQLSDQLSSQTDPASSNTKTLVPNENMVPEDFVMEGSEREGSTLHQLKIRTENKSRKAHEHRVRGEEYVSPKSRKIVIARKIVKQRCNSGACTRYGKKCSDFTDEERKCINEAFYETSSLQLQREYIVRHVKEHSIKQRTVTDHESRRSKSFSYHLPKDTELMPVCKTMFLNTLNISEKTLRTSLAKRQATGTIQKEQRGGRPEELRGKDKERRDAILKHINRFPRVESHYTRQDSKRDYLHPSLTKRLMYEMFNRENNPKGISASYSVYCDVLKSENISFHNPKKDMCKICETYKKGDAEKKKELEVIYSQHTKEKDTVRELKQRAKMETEDNVSVAVFDLQQVIYLPQTHDNQIFYKRRLANYNFTVYNLKSKECHCFTWHECVAKRGSSEIGTCLQIYFDVLNNAGTKEVILFSDGCPGQNKNSIIASMLLQYVTRQDVAVEKISLYYFEPYHGQSEGDSAHSAIKTALDNIGDLYVPSQLVPVFKLARRKKPYIVHTPQTADFLDFKRLSTDLRILSIRSDEQGGAVDWTKMTCVMVKKTEPNRIFFKTSHLQEEYRSLHLMQRQSQTTSWRPSKLYENPPKMSKAKYDDLMSLCEGAWPVIRVCDYVKFFKDLPH